MEEQNCEQLSALVDSELGDDTLTTINILKTDDEARAAWARYHLISDSIRGYLPKHIGRLNQVTDQLLESQAIAPIVRKKRVGILRPLAGLAIAASVTIVIIINIQQVEQDNIVKPLAPANFADLGLQSTSPHDDAYTRLNRYLMNYNEQRANNGVRGMSPHVRMVANQVAQQ